MKHGVAFRKLSRTTSHRMLMLRNLVCSLLEHEQIKTTLPKARETARLAEKIITLGKKGKNNLTAARQAQAFILKPALLPRLFGTLAHRYAKREGGYTRVHKFGRREGDNAPHAIVELVDNPQDLKFDMAARTVGWEVFSWAGMKDGAGLVSVQGPDGGVKPLTGVREAVEKAVSSDEMPGYLKEGLGGRLRRTTILNVRKVLVHRGKAGVQEFIRRAEEYAAQLQAEPVAYAGVSRFLSETDPEKRREMLREYEQSRGGRGAVAGERRPFIHTLSSAPSSPAPLPEESAPPVGKVGLGLRLSNGKVKPTYNVANATLQAAEEQEKSAYAIASGALSRRRAGLGLPGGWFKNKRVQIREREARTGA